MCRYFIFLLFILCITLANGQVIKLTEDLEGWQSIEIKKNIKKNYKLFFEQENRFNQSLTAFKSSLLEVKLAKDCGNNLELGISGRFKLLNKDEDKLDNRIRYGIYIRQRLFKTDLFKAQATIKYLREYISSIEDYNTFWRYKLKLVLDLKKGYKPFFSSEIFRIQEIHRTPYFGTYRMWIGSKKKLNNNAVSLAFGYDRELKSKYPKTTWMIKFKYFIDFK